MDKPIALFETMQTVVRHDYSNCFSDAVPGCSYNYGSNDDIMFNPPHGTPRPSAASCLCVPGCSVNGECPKHGDGAAPVKGYNGLSSPVHDESTLGLPPRTR